jgi:tetratricopeptide (TPR) repeat protein/uncharacterized membrane protein
MTDPNRLPAEATAQTAQLEPQRRIPNAISGELWVLLAIVALAALIRAYHLGYKSLWLHEIVLVSASQQGSLPGPYGSVAPVQSPAFLLLLRLVSSLSQAEWTLRLPAMIASTVGVIALWALGRRLFGSPVALLAAFLLALSPAHLEFAQEVHAGALLATFSTLLLWSLVRAAQREADSSPQAAGKPLRRWLLTWVPFILLATLSLYSQYDGLLAVGLSLVVFPCFLLAATPGSLPTLWRDPERRRAFRHLLGALAATGVLVLPLAIFGLTSNAQTTAGRTGMGSVRWLETFAAFISNRSPWNLDPLFVPTMLLLAVVGLGWLFWRRRAVAVALTLWLALPLLLLDRLGAAAERGLGNEIFILPVLLLLIAAGVVALGQLAVTIVQRLAPGHASYASWARAVVVGLFVLAFLKGSTDPLRATYARPKQDWRGLAGILATAPGPDDAIVLLPDVVDPLRWYYDGPGQVVENDLAAELARLCQTSPAVYMAAGTTEAPIRPADADFLRQTSIEVPLKDLALYYRNCRSDAWYGEGAEDLFLLARRPGLHFPELRRAMQQFDALAAEARAGSAAQQAIGADTAAAPAAAPVPAATVAPTVSVAATAPAVPTVAPEIQAPGEPDLVTDLGAALASLAESAPDDPLTHVRLGAFALQEGASPQQAGVSFQRAIDLDPTSWLAYALWAASLDSAGENEAALALLARGLAAAPDSRALQAMDKRLRGGRPVAPSPGDSPDALGIARQALVDRSWSAAVAAAQEAAAANPDAFEPLLALGDAYRGMSEPRQAADAYARAIELAPQIGYLHARLAEMLTRTGRVDEAIATGLTAISIDQQRWENWYALGRAYAGQVVADLTVNVTLTSFEDARQAEAILQHASSLAPAQFTAPERALTDLRALLATGLLTQDGVEDSADAAQASHSLSAQRARAEQLLRDGKPDLALDAFRQIAQSNPDDRASRLGLADALAALERIDEALAELAAINAQWPDFPFSRTRQGALLEDMGDMTAALAAYREAVQVAPDDSDTHFTLAYALRRAGLREEAIAAFEAGLALEPTRESAAAALDALKREQ